MIIIAEKINATRKQIAAALEARDAKEIAAIAVQQAEAGAHFIDINGGHPRETREVANIAWLMDIVQSNTDLPVAVDTASAKAAKKGLSLAKKKPILNSVSLEKSRLSAMLDIAASCDCMVIALLMSDDGPPVEVDDRLRNAEKLIDTLTGKAGKKLSDIIVDPCVLPVSADHLSGRRLIDAIARIRARWPEAHIGGGLSNISFGLPQRRLVNMAAIAQAIYHGMDTAIIDPCTPGVMAAIHAAEAVAGGDEFCMNYVTAERQGRLK